MKNSPIIEELKKVKASYEAALDLHKIIAGDGELNLSEMDYYDDITELYEKFINSLNTVISNWD